MSASYDVDDLSFRARLAAEKKINVYFIPGKSAKGEKTYTYLVASSVTHEHLVESLRLGAIPDYAVIVEFGYGEPTAEVKSKVKRYYGFDHDSIG